MEQSSDHRRFYRRLAWTGAVLAFGLIVLGGIVRITGSGMGCGDHWPRCDGEWFPPLDLPTFIEIGHRWAAALLSVVVLGLGALAWIRHRGEPALRKPATLALMLLVVQVLLGAVTVKLDLPPAVIIVHLANAMLLLATLTVAALRAGTTAELTGGRHRDHWLAALLAALGFVVVLFGALVANLHAGLLCPGLPLCNGSLAPPSAPLALVQWGHRVLAFGFLVLTLYAAWRFGRRRDAAAGGLRVAISATVAATVAQIAVAFTMVLQLLPAALRATHLMIGSAVWLSLVILAWYSARTPEAEPAAEGFTEPGLARDLVTLTKPRIISLLLVTTVAPMFATGRGVPSAWLVFWVVFAGYLMAGGANAINMWFDRDIDDKMGRTRLRPIPSGRIPSRWALLFGIGLGAVAFGLFWRFVNPLSAWLALGGLLFYVFIYTIWLKRSSPLNIVIGGAAGAFPPLVGWAAMTGSLDLAALYLFAIIFYWTPPHFWALALIKQAEYAKAGVPMLPVVRGERQTKIQMLIYTLALLPLTVMPSAFGALGPFYLVCAVLLGARLLWYCVRLLNEAGVTPTAWKMYRYSLLYLALLFVAMALDRTVPFLRGPARPEVRILDGQVGAAPGAAPAHPSHEH